MSEPQSSNEWSIPQLALLVENVANCLDAGTSAAACSAELRGLAKSISRHAPEPSAEPLPQWATDPDREELIEVLYKVTSVPTSGLALVDAEAIEEAGELLERLKKHRATSTKEAG